MKKYIGVLTAGGDTPGLNAAIRAVGKTAINEYNMSVIGFRDGFRGLMENRHIAMDERALSGILTIGGTILGTSRDKPHKMLIGNKKMDMTEKIIDVYERNNLDALICLGGGGTLKNAFHLHQNGLNVLTLPKTIDNDVMGTDVTFGFDTAVNIATEAIDRLHSTAHSHHRIIVVEIMGHNTGWLALASGIAGGADVILIPEIPYDTDKVANSILERRHSGKHFSIVAVSEGAMSTDLRARYDKAQAALEEAKAIEDKKERKTARKAAKALLAELDTETASSTVYLTRELEAKTRLESRVTILGHVQRGGTPSPVDRLLASRLGAAAAHFVAEGRYGVMVAARGDGYEAVPLGEVVGKRKNIPLDHRWIQTARDLGTSLGD